MDRMDFSFAEWQAIAFDLRTASDQYLSDARLSDQQNNPRLAEQFRSQAESSRKRALRIEEAIS